MRRSLVIHYNLSDSNGLGSRCLIMRCFTNYKLYLILLLMRARQAHETSFHFRPMSINISGTANDDQVAYLSKDNGVRKYESEGGHPF